MLEDEGVARRKVTVNLLGIEAVRLSNGETTLYIDAFAEGIKMRRPSRADYILITHDDGDHFSASKVAAAAEATGAKVIGPPSIAYPLLVDEHVPPEKLMIVYPKCFKEPSTLEFPNVKIKVYNTEHDGDWNPVHVSYLVEFDGRRFYHTGDSSMIDFDDEDLKELDALFWVYNNMDPSGISIFRKLHEKLRPKRILPIHLIGCNWTMTVSDFREEASKAGLEGVVVLDETETLVID